MKRKFLSHKKLTLLSSLLILSSIISGCSNSSTNTSKNINLKGILAKNESTDELYKAAKKEGKVVIYSTSGRAKDAKKSFEKKYPGIKVEVSVLKSDELMNKVTKEQDASMFNADVIITKEVSGAVKNQMVDKCRYLRYLPSDIAANVDEPFKTQSEGYASYLEFRTLFYNTDDFKEAPVKNWWDLTTPEWKGKVYTADPLSNPAFMDLFSTMVINSDDMAKAYKEKFGKDIVLHGTENAGYEFIKELYNNGLVVLKGSDDALDAINKKGKNAVAIAVSGDMSKIEEKSWHVSPIYDIQPKTSVPDPGYVFVAKNAPHSSAAMLYLRWIMGETDGKAKGVDAFNAVGAWIPRKDVKSKNPLNYSDLNLWIFDGNKLYKTSPKVRDFWIGLK